jgi:hypothetical protein
MRLGVIAFVVGAFASSLAPAGSATRGSAKSFAATAATPMQCIPREECCKICRKGQACGNSCIRADYECHKVRGCACDAAEICE